MLGFRLAFQQLEAHADLMDPVLHRFQFGGLIHHMVRSCDLAAIVEPGRHMQGLPLVCIELVAGKGAFFRLTGGGG